jgi:hypothetical protein
MSDSEEETYSAMFSSLRHPARRKILRMLSEKSMTFSEILEYLGVPSSHLTYQLESLGDLVLKKEDGKYTLSKFGEAAIAMMKGAEEAPPIQRKSFSSLPLRWKSLYAVLIIAIVVLASMSYGQYATYNQLSKDYNTLGASFQKMQSQNQQLLSGSTAADEAMALIKNVFQIDVSKYQVTLLSDTVGPDAALQGVVEEVLTYSLVNNASNVNLVLTFRNGNFSLFQLNVIEGVTSFTPIYTQHQPTDFLTAVRDVITRYKSVDNASYLNQMSQLLSAATETQQEQTLGNVKLEISLGGDNAQFSLLYTANNVDFAAKSLQIVFENGILTSLSDDWPLYSVGSTQMNITQDQAIQIAREAASSFTWKANGGQVSNFTVLQEPVSAVFFPKIRTGLTLFPYWYVTLYLDKVYPGGINSIGVGVWADTGQVANIQTLSS